MHDAAAPPPARVTALLRAIVPLGAARVVLRTCSGLAEVVCSTADLAIQPPWAVLTTAEASIHVELAALRGAELRGGRAPGEGPPPSICFVGRCGSPCLVVVLDRAAGAERAHQAMLFRALRARWGARISLEAEHAIEGRHWLQ